MTDLTEAKPGDTLCIYNRHTKWLDKIDRVTPTGRVILKNGSQFDPSGYKRGDSGWNRTQARIATEDDIADIYRAGLVSKIERFRAWDKLSADDLKAAAGLVAKYQLPN